MKKRKKIPKRQTITLHVKEDTTNADLNRRMAHWAASKKCVVVKGAPRFLFNGEVTSAEPAAAPRAAGDLHLLGASAGTQCYAIRAPGARFELGQRIHFVGGGNGWVMRVESPEEAVVSSTETVAPGTRYFVETLPVVVPFIKVPPRGNLRVQDIMIKRGSSA